MSRVFGIDLGTTYSCIAYLDEYGKPVVLKNSEGEHTTPSVVMVESDANIVVGTEAKRSVKLEPGKTVQFIKRKMGKEDDKVVLDGTAYSAPEISAYILKKLAQDANSELRQTGVLADGEEIKDVVITCPAYFGMNERQATRNAGELAGLNVLDIINEPTAAAISYGAASKNGNETVLVYDLGGGTFDITVMRIENNDVTVLCTGGDDQLGGKDWDECLMFYVTEKYNEEHGEDLMYDPEAVATLYSDVETWKKSLTSREKVNISVTGSGGRYREELTREKYDELTHDLLNRTKNLLDNVLEEAGKKGCSLKDIDRILLVGGSSRMPQVAAMIERDYGIVPVLADPDEAVAKGAAIYAGNKQSFESFVQEEAQRTGKTVESLKEENLLTGDLDKGFLTASGQSEGRISVTNVLSRTYGLETLIDGVDKVTNMLMMNAPLPARVTKSFGTSSNNQASVELKIYESRSNDEVMEIEGQKPITTINMRFRQEVPINTEIVITFALDGSGILHIVAEEKMHNSRLDTTFELSNQMSESEKRSALTRMQSANVE